ncbi:MAG: shikimate dehydrogenase [Pseudomonadota bacterium]|jgi:shikimate dehydrogenase
MTAPDRYAVIGFPVAHSRSPFIHEHFARQAGQRLVYGRIEVEPAGFTAQAQAFFAGGGRGLNVTMPFKLEAAALCSDLSPRAERAGAVNTLRCLPDGSIGGDNTDGAGLVRDLLHNQGVAVAGRRVLLLGAGGAARGAVQPLLALQPRLLCIANRNADRARDLAAMFAAEGAVTGCGFGELDAEPFDLVINATAASLAGDVPPLPQGIVEAHSFCYDMAYGAADTPFVRWAQARGCQRAAMGLGMLVEQAAEAFFIWRGIRPDTGPVLAALRAELMQETLDARG